MTSLWGVPKVKYTKLDGIQLLEMAEGEGGVEVDFSSTSVRSTTGFVSLDGDGGGFDDLGGKDAVDGFGDFEPVGVRKDFPLSSGTGFTRICV